MPFQDTQLLFSATTLSIGGDNEYRVLLIEEELIQLRLLMSNPVYLQLAEINTLQIGGHSWSLQCTLGLLLKRVRHLRTMSMGLFEYIVVFPKR